MIARPNCRAGYTLLEVLIASLIALVLLGGLYAALNITLVRMDANRDQIAGNDLSRAIFNRVGADMANTLGPLPPKSGGDGETGGSSASSDTTTTAAATTTTADTTSATPAASTTTTEGETTSPAAAGVDVPFGAGIVGTDKQLKIILSRTPAVLVDIEAGNTDAGQPADLRSVFYYLAADGFGLCRQERPWVTADGVWNSTEPDRTDETTDIIAPEVKDLTFEYYDGGTWQSSWDGTATDLDGVSLIGPPRAIKVILVLEFRGRAGPVQKRVVQIIPIRAAVGNYIPETTTDSTTTTTPATTGGN